MELEQARMGFIDEFMKGCPPCAWAGTPSWTVSMAHSIAAALLVHWWRGSSLAASLAANLCGR
eukprot:1149902-Prorocentrum_lima.AAC.1